MYYIIYDSSEKIIRHENDYRVFQTNFFLYAFNHFKAAVSSCRQVYHVIKLDLMFYHSVGVACVSVVRADFIKLVLNDLTASS